MSIFGSGGIAARRPGGRKTLQHRTRMYTVKRKTYTKSADGRFSMRCIATLLFACMIWLTGAFAAEASDAKDIFGIWRHPDNGSLVQIYACENAICAKVVRVDDPSRRDVNNPDAALRKRPILGIVVWRHGKAIGPNLWAGSLYNTLDGGSYYGTLRLSGKSSLELSGCVFRSMLCDHRTWRRVNPALAKAVQATLGAKSHGHALPALQTLAKKSVTPKRRVQRREQGLWEWLTR
jgi:uncharacterized protein (DUF2147 family)